MEIKTTVVLGFIALNFSTIIQRSVVISLLLIPGATTVRAQIIGQPVPKPASGTVSLDHETATAGDSIKLTLTLDVPPSEDLGVRATFACNAEYAFGSDLAFKAGTTTQSVQIDIPKYSITGDYVLREVELEVPVNWIHIPVNPMTVHVTALPDKVVLPTKVSATLEADQRQFIRTQTEPLIHIRQTLIGQLSRDATDTPNLRADLIDSVSAADDLIPATRDKYLALYKESPILEPVLFDDFDRRYKQILVQLRSPTWPNAPLSDERSQSGRFVLAQLQTRKPPTNPPDEDWSKNGELAVYPPDAEVVLTLIRFNIRAYEMIGQSGVDTFAMRLASHPIGATVFYRRIGEGYQQLSKRTNIDSVIFPYAMWTFKFELEGCDSLTEDANPYIEEHPDMDVELKCRKK